MAGNMTAVATLTINSIMYALYYFYIFVLNRHRYLALWGFSWIAYSLGYLLYLMTADQGYSVVFKHFFSLFSSMLLLIGTMNFLNSRGTGRRILSVLLLMGLILIGCMAFSSIPGIVQALSISTAILLMLISVVSGLAFLISDDGCKDAVRQITGWLFIVWGVHKGFYPFVSPDFYASEVNCLSSIVLINAVNMSIILCYLGQSGKLLLEKEVQYRLLAEASAKRLSSLEIMRRKFLANISHELRTPITAIIGYLSIIMDDLASSDKDVKYYAKQSLDKSFILNTLIQDLFDLSTKEAMELSLNREAIQVDVYFALLDEKFRPEQENSRVRVRFLPTCDSDLRQCPHILVDRMRIEQVFQNLISNAVKNIPREGSVSISCGCAKRKLHKNAKMVNIYVKDTGVGIDEADLPFIFEMFYKRSNVRNTGGTGLGLSMSEYIVQAHGGAISAESAPGAGATFTLELPIERSA
jgi:signal transduction histidine kinase